MCRYRTLKTAAAALTVVWLLSFALMLPVLLFVDHVPQTSVGGLDHHSCVVRWPSSHGLLAVRAYLTYTALVGFLCPLAVVVALYALLVYRLRVTRRHIRSRGMQVLPERHGRRVVNIVTVIVVTYMVCWLPYWSFQVRHSYSARALVPARKLTMWVFTKAVVPC